MENENIELYYFSNDLEILNFIFILVKKKYNIVFEKIK